MAEATGGLLHLLSRGAKGFPTHIGDAMPQIGQYVREMALSQRGHLRHRRHSTMGSPPESAGEERPGRTRIAIFPELAEALFQRPDARHLEVRVLQRAERGPLVCDHVRGAHEPGILGAREPRVIRLLQRRMFGAADPIDGLRERLGHIKIVEDDRAVGLRHMSAYRLDIRSHMSMATASFPEPPLGEISPPSEGYRVLLRSYIFCPQNID